MRDRSRKQVRRVLSLIASALAATAIKSRADTAFEAFPTTGVHIGVDAIAAAENVPTGIGQVYDASGNTNDINVVNFSTTIYTGLINVSSTIARIANNQSVYAKESDDGGFFNFNGNELANIPRMGMNYYMEFMVWPLMNLSAGTYDTTDTPYNTSGKSSGDTFPGPERIIMGSGGEVYYTGDHYSTSENVYPTSPLAAISVNSWNNATGSWSSVANWSSSHVPVAGEAAYLSVQDENTRTVTYDYAGAAVTLGDFLVNADGTATSHGSMTMQQSTGTLTTSKEEVWARDATAAVIQTGGTDTVNGALHIGSLLSSVGAYNLSGGSLLVGGDEYIGSTELVAAAGTGNFNQTGGAQTITGTLHLGFAAGGTGTYLLQSGSLTAGTINVNAGGTLNQTGGTLSYSNFNQTAGSVIFASTATIANATYNLSGGTLSEASLLQINAGGTLNVTGTGTFSALTFNVSGGTASLPTLLVKTTGGNAAAVNVSSGTLNVSTLNVSTGTLAITGGTLNLLTHTGTPLADVISSLAISNTGQLNVSNNALDLPNASLTTINALVKQGFNNGTWTGSGINSGAAASNSLHLTALGVIQNNQSSPSLYSGNKQFENVIPGIGDVLVKYTYYGDADLSGKVDASDYSRIDNGYASQGTQTGWFNGDFNYDGIINGSDYTLIDNAFNSQGTQITGEIADPSASTTAEIAGSSSVPEPNTIAMLGLAMFGLLGRRMKAYPSRAIVGEGYCDRN